MENKYEFKIIQPDPITFLPEYYIVRGQVVPKETFQREEFLKMVIADGSYVHVTTLAPEEILERYSEVLTPDQIETLKNHVKTVQQKEP